MGVNLKGLSFYEKALEIYQKALPPNHPSSATFYADIAGVYYNMGDYSKALSYLERAGDIQQCLRLSPNHPDVQNVRRGIEIITKKF